MPIRLWTLGIVVLVAGGALTAAGQDVDSAGDDSSELDSPLIEPFDKREFKLRSHNPLHIYNQWLRQPRYPSKVSSLREDPVSAAVAAAAASAGGHDIPRRLIRNNKTHLGAPPLFVWNHQLLPNFHNKRHPPYFASLRRDYYSAGARKQAAKRSNLARILLPRAYEGQEFRYEEPVAARFNSGEAGYDMSDVPSLSALDSDSY